LSVAMLSAFMILRRYRKPWSWRKLACLCQKAMAMWCRIVLARRSLGRWLQLT